MNIRRIKVTDSGKNPSAQPSEAPWITAPCFMFTNQCGLTACVENGKVTKIKGLPVYRIKREVSRY
jgi:hypothetical protein